jgi:hypothetical protein
MVAQNSVESYNSDGDDRCAWYEHSQWFEDHTWEVHYQTTGHNIPNSTYTIELREIYLHHREES